MATTKFLTFPEYYNDHPSMLRQIVRVGQGVMQGKTNNTGTFTLTANAASTALTFADGQLGINTVILWQPTTANAAGAMNNLYEDVSIRSVTTNATTLKHSNTATTDRTFYYILVG